MAEDELQHAAAGAIVVGVDDSESARAALAAGIEEGARRRLPVLAVTVYGSPSAWSREVSRLIDEDRLGGEVQRAAQRIVDRVVAEQRERGIEAPSVRAGLRTGAAAEVLSRLSQDAALLVVGDRGRGAVARRLVGSVVLGVILHARCPVLVARPPSRTGSSGHGHAASSATTEGAD